MIRKKTSGVEGGSSGAHKFVAPDKKLTFLAAGATTAADGLAVNAGATAVAQAAMLETPCERCGRPRSDDIHLPPEEEETR